jgi:phosphate transport system substrate-binding protein
MSRIFTLILVAAILLAGCGNDTDKVKNNDTPLDTTGLKGEFKVMGTQALYPMMVKWSANFIEANPGVKIIVRATQSDKAMKLLDEGESSIAMISRELTQAEIDSGYWAAPVAFDAVIPIISFNNHHIQPMVMKGASPAELKSVFTGKVTKWGDLAGRKGDQTIHVYCLSDSSGTGVTWNGFLGIDPGEIKATPAVSEADMFLRVKNDPYAIGYCSILEIFNVNTDLKKEGIYVLPIDFNGDNVVNDNEQYYDKLSILSDAVSKGKLPWPPARKLNIVTRGKPTDPLLMAFIEWILTIGQNYMPEMGYIHLSPDSAQAVIKSMK